MKIALYSLVGFASLILSASAKRIVYDWTVDYLDANPDGRHERRVISINGAYPPPPIEANQGDTVVVNLQNNLDVPTALHAHGLYENGTSNMDGPNMITQCPVPPGKNYTYIYDLSLNKGTYWYHAHYRGQYMDGFVGPLIIHAKEEPYEYDEDVTINIADWYHNQSETNLAWYLSKANSDGAEPVPQSALINYSRNTTFNFVPGKTYRLRLLNQSGFSTFWFSIDGHEMEVIEADGVEVEKYKTKAVYLTAAQRLSVLVKAKESPKKNYLMHADMALSMFDYIPSDLQPNTTATLIYDEDNDKIAESEDLGASGKFDDIYLKPLEKMDAVDADTSFNLTVEFGITSDGLNRGMFNKIPWVPSLTPTLYSALTTGKDAWNPKTYGEQGRAFVYKHLDMIELVINNFDDGSHPMHLHGHVFQVVARGHDAVYNATGSNDNVEWYLDNPMRRDTVQVPGGGFVILRFRADNPGTWFFHCHIDWHLSAGLASVMVEAPDLIQQKQKIPEYMKQNCVDLGLHYSGNAAGRKGFNLKGAPHGLYLLDPQPADSD